MKEKILETLTRRVSAKVATVIIGSCVLAFLITLASIYFYWEYQKMLIQKIHSPMPSNKGILI